MEAEILRLGESMCKGMKAEFVMPHVGVSMHTHVFVVQVKKQKK